MRLVLAYGNPLRSDDGVGWRVARALSDLPNVEVECVQQLVPELALRVADAEGVLFLDAEVGEPPGRVQVREILAREDDGGLGHVAGPDRLLGLARRLLGVAPPSQLLTVTAADLAFGSRLSVPVAAALPAAIDAARSALAALAARNACVAIDSKH
jgi:hydrogenase maturation protease